MYRLGALCSGLTAFSSALVPEPEDQLDGRTNTVRMPISIGRRGRRKLVLAPHVTNVTAVGVVRSIDNSTSKGIRRAFRWREMLENGTDATLAEIAAAEKKTDPTSAACCGRGCWRRISSKRSLMDANQRGEALLRWSGGSK
jgi:hypothetical protein